MVLNRTHNALRNNKGFTLIELMVSITIFSIALFTFSKIINIDYFGKDVPFKLIQNYYGPAEVFNDTDGRKSVRLLDPVSPMTVDISEDERLNDLPIGKYKIKDSLMILKDQANPDDHTKDKAVKVVLKSD